MKISQIDWEGARILTLIHEKSSRPSQAVINHRSLSLVCHGEF